MRPPFSARIGAALASGLIGAASVSALAQPDCLTTTFADNNGWAGNMFDIEPHRDLDLSRWQVNVSGTDLVTISIYWRDGSYQGYERDPEAWTLIGTATTQGQGSGYPTSVNVGDLPVSAGRTYGIYVHLESYEPGSRIRYTNGEPTIFENTDLKLTTGVGRGSPAFSGSIDSNRRWNGTICYESPRPLMAVGGVCPGYVSIAWDRTRPDRWAGVFYGSRLGSYTLLEPCWGVQLEITGNLRVVRHFRTGSEGEGRLTGRAPGGFCGGYLQMVVGDPQEGCVTSNVVQIP